MPDSVLSVGNSVVQIALDGLALRQRVIANNIANANSAGFSAQRVDFETALRAAAGGLDSAATQTQLQRFDAALNTGAYIHRADTPAVQLDMEMERMNETLIRYQALIQGLNQSNSLVQMAINGGN